MKKLFFCFLFAILCTGNLSAQIISTYAGNGSTTFSGDGGAATSAGFVQPWAAATDRFGNLYIVDFWGARVRKVNTAGVISTFAGNGSSGYGGDGGAATMAQLEYPTGIATDTAGNIYIVNENSIRKVNSLGMISTVAGSATAGFSGDGGLATAALLNISYGIAADNSGNIYIADQANNRIRKVNAAGIISTIAGNGILGFGGDGGQATDAELNQPEGIAVDDTGNVYIGDRDNGRVRKVSISGIITTIAGNGTIGYAGDGGPATDAEFSSVIGLCVDHSGNIICADASNNCVRKISTTGMISTIAGNDTMGYSGDGGPATAAEMNQVYSVCMNNTQG